MEKWVFYCPSALVTILAIGIGGKYGRFIKYDTLLDNPPVVDQNSFKFVILECIVLIIYAVDIEASPAVLIMIYILTVTFMISILVLVFFAGAKVLLNEIASRDSFVGELAKNIDKVEAN